MTTELILLIKDNLENKRGVKFENSPTSGQQNEKNILIQDASIEDDFVKYIFYDCCSEGKFDFEKFKNVKENLENDNTIISVFIFKDLKQEHNYRNQSCSTKNAKEKREILSIFEQKISYYIDSSKSVNLNLEDDGINFLEYNNGQTPNVYGKVYNINMFEIFKLFNVTGTELFKRNVRIGINNKTIQPKKLKENFKKYFQASIFNFVSDSNSKEKLKQLWTLTDDEVSNLYKDFSPHNFWFGHNGITFFVENDKESLFSTQGTVIRLNPNKVSVINGAQTLTNLYNLNEELNEEVSNILEIGTVDRYLIQTLERLYVKAIFIVADESVAPPITNALNTQIPIEEKQSLATSSSILEINKALYKIKAKVIRPGESHVNGLDVLRLCKLYLMTSFEYHPGKSKNFPNKQLEKTIKDIESKLKSNDKETLLKDLETCLSITNWWSSNSQKTEKNSDSDDIKTIKKYGKNYFHSYFILTNEDNKGDVEDEILEQSYTHFLQDFSKYSVSLNAFKTDELFTRFKDDFSKPTPDNIGKSPEEGIEQKLLEFLNEHLASETIEQKNGINSLITIFLIENNIPIKNFRTIPMIEKNNNWEPKEAFPFSNSTFNNIFENVNYEDDAHSSWTDFDDSIFKREIQKNFDLFVIYWENRGNEPKKIEKIKYLKNFSFTSYIKQAEETYQKTLDAFDSGDINEFPKTADKLSFHIRPKAKNADDGFLFSNGKFETKRTFWANTETILDLINKAQ